MPTEPGLLSSWGLLGTLAWPLALAVAAFVAPRLGNLWGLAGAAGVIASVAAVVAGVLNNGVLTHEIGAWAPPLGIVLRVDGLSAIMLAVTAVVGGVASLYSVGYLRPLSPALAPEPDAGAKEQRYFWPLWLFLWAALNALFISGDAFNLYVTLELLGLSATALVALNGEARALNAAMRYLLISLLSSVSYLLGVGLLYGQTGALDLQLIAERLQPGVTSAAAAGLIITGLLLKSALFPLHFWLPAAHSNAPAPVSAVLSGLVVKATFYLVLRYWFQVFPDLATPTAGQFLGLLGAAAILWGSLQAMLAERLKLLVAYSTVAQLGYLFLVFALASGDPAVDYTAWTAAVFYLLAHAGAKAAMFLAAGSIMRAAGHDRIAELHGISHRLPVSMFAFGVAGINLVGLPPSGGFIGKWLMLNAAFTGDGLVWAVVILLGGLLSAVYVMRVLAPAFVGTPGPGLGVGVRRTVPWIMEWSALALAVLALALGFVAAWPLDALRIGSPWAGARLMGTMP